MTTPTVEPHENGSALSTHGQSARGDEPVLPSVSVDDRDVSVDDRDVGWGDVPAAENERDEHYLRERPPHHGD